MTNQVMPGKNHQVSNFPFFEVSDLAINRWKDNTVAKMKLNEKVKISQEIMSEIYERNIPEYNNAIGAIFKQE